MHLINSNLFLNGVFKWDKKINRNIDLYFCETVLKTKIVCLKCRDDVFPMRLEDWLLVIFPEARPCGNYLCLSNIISDYRSVKWDIKTLVAMRFASDQTQISTICSLQWFPIQSSNPLLFLMEWKLSKKDAGSSNLKQLKWTIWTWKQVLHSGGYLSRVICY